LTYVKVAAGSHHSVALRSDNSVVAWGLNNKGQCNVPSLPSWLTYVEFAAGYEYTVARYERSCPGTTVYCTAKVNSLGCTPSIGFQGTPSASQGSGFTVSTTNLLDNQIGLYFYSKSGPNNAPFQGGFLCGKAPLVRTPVQNSGGALPCGGSYTLDFNAYIASGADPALIAGQPVWIQTWSPDPGFAPPNNSSLSDALEFTICP
ncbi:MAG TPA: RCC1 domain-containing protein, partial [Planctomycetota bacterium]|nr:RCC1 domain-containing protein [Planctomycetota bacterium]